METLSHNAKVMPKSCADEIFFITPLIFLIRWISFWWNGGTQTNKFSSLNSELLASPQLKGTLRQAYCTKFWFCNIFNSAVAKQEGKGGTLNWNRNFHLEIQEGKINPMHCPSKKNGYCNFRQKSVQNCHNSSTYVCRKKLQKESLTILIQLYPRVL